MSDYKQKLIAVLEELEVQNIDRIIDKKEVHLRAVARTIKRSAKTPFKDVGIIGRKVCEELGIKTARKPNNP